MAVCRSLLATKIDHPGGKWGKLEGKVEIGKGKVVESSRNGRLKWKVEMEAVFCATAKVEMERGKWLK